MNSHKLLTLAAVFAGLIFVSSASAQNVTVISGNGQVLGAPSGNFLLQPLVIQVTDSSTGAPVGAGVTVNWQANGFNGFFLASGTNTWVTTTDVSGQSTAYYQLAANVPTFDITTPYIQTTITATAGKTATFTLTQLAKAPQVNIAPFITVRETGDTVPRGITLTGAVGTTGPSIQFQLGAGNGQTTKTLPRVAVQILNLQDPAKGPSVSCANTTNSDAGVNTVLSDDQGFVTCTPLYGGQPGPGLYLITVGGVSTGIFSSSGYWQPLPDPTDLSTLPAVQTAYIFTTVPPFKVNVTPGAAGTIKFSSPSSGTQAALPGTTVPISVEVDNTAGLPISGTTVNWTVISPTTGVNVTNTSTTSDANGKAFNNIIIGNAISGAVTIRAALATDATKSVTFTINVSPPVTISQFQIISGNNQTAVVNTSFAQPLVVKVTTTAGPGANIPVSFQVASGSLSLSATTVNTDANGIAQVNVTAGSVTGSGSVLVTVAGNNGAGALTFLLNVGSQAPVITSGNFVNGADGQLNSLSPCGLGALVTNVGTLGINAVTSTFPGAPIPNSPIQIAFANTSAPILNIGTNANGLQQVLFQVPCEVAPGTGVPVTITVGSGAATNVNVNVQPAAPGVFQSQYSDGTLRAVLVRPDGSYVSLANPARPGETVVAYATGLGPTTPSVSTRSVPAPTGSAMVQGTVIPGINGGGAQLVYAKLSQDLPGTYVVAFQIPSDAPTSNDVNFSIGVTPPGSSTTYYSALSKVPVRQ